MTWAPWVWLALAVLLVPALPETRARALNLAARGRLTAEGARTLDAAVRPPPSRTGAAVVPSVVVVAIGGPVVGGTLLAGPAVGLAALVAGGAAARLGLAARGRRRRERADAQLLAALRLAAAELEAGASPAVALGAAAQLAPLHAAALTATAAALGAGSVPDPVVPADHAGRPGSSGAAGLAGFAPAWQMATTTGAPLAEVCARVARDLAARIDQRAAVVTALAGARSSAALLAVLPVLGLALGSAMQADPVAVLCTTPTGHALLVLGVVLDVAGLLWTHRLAAGAERP